MSVLVMLLLVAIAMLIASAVVFNRQMKSPVCHSVTEDSVIYDCDYRDGGWYQK
jgi:hypothetical protein